MDVRTSARVDRTYALVEVREQQDAVALAEAIGATAYDAAIIALAVFPERGEALPFLLEALGGAGRPSGVIDCTQRADGIVVEWRPDRAGTQVVTGVIDVEMRRFGGARTAELLSPLSDSLLTEIAAGGMQAPTIAPERMLEALLERAGLMHDA